MLTKITYTKDNWNEMIKAMHSGETIEINEDVYEYFLEVLPPVYMNKKKVIDGLTRTVNFGMCEGMEKIVDFWTDRTLQPDDSINWSYFCKQSNDWNPRGY